MRSHLSKLTFPPPEGVDLARTRTDVRVTFDNGDETYVHSLVLMLASPVFKSMLQAPMAVTIIRRPARANDEMAPASTLASVLPAALSCCPSVSSVVRRS